MSEVKFVPRKGKYLIKWFDIAEMQKQFEAMMDDFDSPDGSLAQIDNKSDEMEGILQVMQSYGPEATYQPGDTILVITEGYAPSEVTVDGVKYFLIDEHIIVGKFIK
jgi:hypothetical protein